MRRCRDCRWVIAHDPAQGQPVCHHPQSFGQVTDWYTGEVQTVPRPIAIMRTFGTCRAEGLLFEVKEFIA